MASSTRFPAIFLRLSVILISRTAIFTAPEAGAQVLPASAQHFRYVFDIPQGYINDHSLINAQGLWHLFFIQGQRRKSPWDSAGNEIIIGHATSPDLLTWTLHDPALKAGSGGCDLDAGHIYAPSVIEREGKYYMFYTGNEGSFYQGERIFMATSTDLFKWTRNACAPVITPDPSWAAYYAKGYANGKGGPVSGRDPFVFKDPRGGYICYYVARFKVDSSRMAGNAIVEEEREDFACVAAATSTDLVNWVDRGPVLIRPVGAHEAYTHGHPESPCVIERDGRYYLFWKGGAGTRYVISRDPLNFRDRSEYILSTSHASKIFQWNNQWYITSASRDIDDVAHTRSDRSRGLFLASIRWDATHPIVTSLEAPAPQGAAAATEEVPDWAK